MKTIIKAAVGFSVIAFSMVYGSEQKRLIIRTIRNQQKVVLRSEPHLKGTILKELAGGIVVNEIGKTSQKDTVEGLANYWHEIAIPDGTRGWVFGANTRPFDPELESERYKDLYRELRSPLVPNLAMSQHSFSDYVYVFHVLTAVIPEVKDAEAAAKLKLGRAMCLQRSLPFGVKNEPPDFAAWVKEHEDYIHYDQFRAQWLLAYDVLWNLHNEYRKLPIADDIAWEAANNPLGGECENDFLCILKAHNITVGMYLRLHPDGLYVSAALERLISFFERCLEKPPDYFGASYKDYPGAKPELELMRETLKSVLETKDARPERALRQFAETFKIYLKKDERPAEAENEKIVIWDKVMHAYDAYLDYPSTENAKALAETLPKGKPDSMIGEWGKALEHVFSRDNYPILDAEILAGDRWATEVAFRLLNVTDGHYTETLLTTLGILVRINPHLFLEVTYEYKDSWFVKEVGYPVWFVGFGYSSRKLARKYNLEMRIKAFESVKDAKYAEIRDGCIRRLLESVNKSL